MNRELKIDGIVADIPATGAALPIYKFILDYNSPAERGGDATNIITLPYTKVNRLIFGDIPDGQTLRKFTRIEAQQATYTVNGVEVFRGKCEVKSASTGGYSVEFVSDNIAWVDNLSENKLQTLAMETVGFIGDSSEDPSIEPPDALTQRDIWALDAYTCPVQFDLVAYGNYYRNSTDSGERAWLIQNVGWQSIPPQVFFRPVLIQLLKEAGLQPIGSFIDDPEFTALISPFVGEGDVPWNWGFLAQCQVERVTSYLYEVGIGSPLNTDFQYNTGFISSVTGWFLQAVTKAYDYSDSYFVTSPDQEYIVPAEGVYTFTIEVDVSALDKFLEFPAVVFPTNHYRVGIAIVRVPDNTVELEALYADLGLYLTDGGVSAVSNTEIIGFFDFGTGYADSPMTNATPSTAGTTYTQIFNGIPMGTPGSAINGSGIVSMEIGGAKLSRADRVQVWLVNATPGSYMNGLQITADTYNLTILETSHPTRLNPASLLPDWTRLEFFNGLIRMFNLHYLVDPVQGTILLERRENFYKPASLAVDWTPFARLSDGTTSPLPFAALTTFKYSEDTADALLTRHGVGFSQYEATELSIHSDKDTDTIDLPWAPTADRVFRARQNPPAMFLLNIPCMSEASVIDASQAESEWQYNFTARVLRHLGLRPGGWRYENNFETEYPAARFSFDEVDGLSLCWADTTGQLNQRGSIIDAETPSTGLYSRHWEKLSQDRVNGHVLTLPVKFDAATFAAIDPSRPVKIEGVVFYIYQIEGGFDPSVDTVITVRLMRF